MVGWSIIQTFTLPQDAYMAKAYLESAGIATMLQDEMTAQVYNFGSNAIGGVKLLVQDSNWKESERLLLEGGYLQSTDWEQREDWVWVKKTADRTHCPFCHSDNIAKDKILNIAAVILYFVFGALFPIFRFSYRCYDCGKAWKYRRQI